MKDFFYKAKKFENNEAFEKEQIITVTCYEQKINIYLYTFIIHNKT